MIDLTEGKLTFSQALALHKVFRRTPLLKDAVGKLHSEHAVPLNTPTVPATFEDFLKTVQIGSDCLMVPWCGMWLGIEPDGHTHS